MKEIKKQDDQVKTPKAPGQSMLRLLSTKDLRTVAGGGRKKQSGSVPSVGDH